MKKFFTQLHLWLSLPFGIVIGIVCLTGALLLFEDEILEARHPERYFIETSDAAPLASSALIAKVQAQLPDSVHVTGLKRYGAPDRTVLCYLHGQKESIFVNPYTGDITGRDKRSTFFRNTVSLHRRLMHEVQKGETPWGKWIVGTATIGFVFILLSGLIIWFPKQGHRLSRRLTVKTGKGAFRFWYDVHVAGGFYAVVFLLLMALTGLTWSFPWYRTPFYTLLGADPAEIAQPRKRSDSDQTFQPVDHSQWDQVTEFLQQRYPDYNTLTLEDGQATVQATDYGNVYARDEYRFNPTDGKLTEVVLDADRTAYSRLRNWVYCVHTGSWGGLTTRLLYFASTVLGVIFCLTGYWFWWRKWRKRRNFGVVKILKL